MFNSKKELAMAIIDGRKFKTRCGCTLFFDDAFVSPFRVNSNLGNETMQGEWNLFGEVTEIKEWYEEPFKPCLCWVSDLPEFPGRSAGIVVSKSKDMFNTTSSTPWKYATRMTMAEVLEYCYEEIN